MLKRNLIIPLLMLFVLSSQIVIGNVSMNSVANVNIKKGWKDLTDVAVIEFPKNVKFTTSDKTLTDVIKKGDKVSIRLGYNDVLSEEFTGYVSLIEQTIPIRITCEDEMYNLKRSTVTKSWQSANLKDVISFIAPNYKTDVADVNLGAFQINKASPARVLKYLKEKYGLVSFFRDNTLVVGFPYRFTPQGKVYVYDFQKNVADNSLEYRKKEDRKLQIKAISNLKNGKKRIVTVGDEDGDTETRNFPEMSETDLRNLANAALESQKFDGYTGDITGFGLPLVNPTEVAALVDNEFPDRKGTYFIDELEIDFGVSGYRRKVTVGKKLNMLK